MTIPGQRVTEAGGGERRTLPVGLPVWAVHVTCGGPSGIEVVGPVELITSDEARANDEAVERSRAPNVLAAAVTRYVVDELGNRRRTALFVDGKRQKEPHRTDANVYRIG